jgi:hypothetical protein
MAKLKLRELIDNNFSLALKKVSEQPLSALQSWSLVKLQKKVNEQVTAFEEARVASIKKFASLKEDGNLDTEEGGVIKFKSEEDKTSAIKEIEELLNQEVEVPDVKLSSIANLQIDAMSMAFLEKIVSE